MASAWKQLPQLQELDLIVGGSADQRAATLAGVAAATTLTTLSVAIDPQAAVAAAAAGLDQGVVAMAACASFAGLKRLRSLELFNIYPGSALVPGDALALTALTGLTYLAIRLRESEGVGDAVATVLAQQCQHLQFLGLEHCGVHSVDCMAAIGRLVQLTQLRLERNSGITQQGLMQLTGLSNLRRLALLDSEHVTQQMVQQCLARAQPQHQGKVAAWRAWQQQFSS
jgi:hypothetical protein